MISLKSLLSSIVFLILDLVFYFQLVYNLQSYILYPNFTNQNTTKLFFYTFVLGVLLWY